jgi:choline dehydrogenase-like flavoprotein
LLSRHHDALSSGGSAQAISAEIAEFRHCNYVIVALRILRDEKAELMNSDRFFSNFQSSKVNRRQAIGSIAGGLTFPGAIGQALAQTGIRVVHSPEDLGRTYDYLIIGAGSAGCVLAHRLAQAGRSVLLIEAGAPATLPAISVPPDWPQLQGSSADWRYVTVPQRHLGGRIIPYPRGKVVGGSSAINALAYQRGHRAAFDRWPESWRFADLLPYFRRAETFSGGSSEWRGGDGPLHVLSLADVEDRTPLASAFIAAAQSLGFPETKDIGGENATGVCWNQLTIKGHERDDAATAYLGNLANVKVDLLVETEVQKLHIENGRCKGVQLANRIARPEIETLLCAGAIDSPRILMLSGIGPADHISSFGIGVAVDLPDVGNHLEDHLLLAGVAYSARQEVPRSHYNHADAMLYVPNRDPDDSPDILIMCLSIPFVLPSVGKITLPAYVLVPCLMKPRSQGSVRLASADTSTPALIDPNYLGDSHDRDVLVEGVGLAREIGSTAAFADWRADEVYPGPRSVSLEDLHTFISRAANSFHHPVGTCRIGKVVDDTLHVKGVADLRVVDASVMPGIPQAVINAATIAVAERASDLILGN